MRSIIGLMSLTLLTGCAVHKESFDCAPGQGVGCKSISRVNGMMDRQEELEHNLSAKTHAVERREVPHASMNQASIGTLHTTHTESKNLPLDLSEKAESSTAIQRSSERILSIWIAPFEDEEGNWHEASRIHAVVQKSHWRP